MREKSGRQKGHSRVSEPDASAFFAGELTSTALYGEPEMKRFRRAR
jgi:hypothetical protein